MQFDFIKKSKFCSCVSQFMLDCKQVICGTSIFFVMLLKGKKVVGIYFFNEFLWSYFMCYEEDKNTFNSIFCKYTVISVTVSSSYFLHLKN